MDCKIQITGSGLNFEQGITLSQAGQIMAFIGSQSDVVHAPPQNGSSSPQLSAQAGAFSREAISPREFLNESGAKSYSQMVVALGRYYLMHRASNEDEGFDSATIQNLLREVKEPPSSNIQRDIRRAVQAGWISSVPGARGRYWVTNTGEQNLESKFTNAVIRKSRDSNAGSRSSTGRTRGVLQLREEVKQLEIHPKLEGMPDYWEFAKEKNMKILWILGAARQLGVESLSTGEINYIATKMLIDKPFSNVSVFAKPLQVASLARNSDGAYSILKHGIDLLQKKSQPEEVL